MKTILFILLALICFSSYAQENDRVAHAVFFMTPKDHHVRDLSVGDYCIIGLRQNSRVFQGEIGQIRQDTISIQDTIIKIKDIAYFCFQNELKSPILLSKPSDMPAKYILFEKDTLVWKAIIPPGSIYGSSWDYNMYVRELESTAKRGAKTHVMRDPFHKQRKPVQKQE